MSLTDRGWQESVTSARPAPALGQHIVDHLRRLIITRALPAGTHLVESQLSETFDVSRGPVRDALRQLATEGLVESRRRGAYVIGLTLDDIDELYYLRQLIETAAVRLSIARRIATRDQARAAITRMRSAAREQNAAAFAVADLDFHSSFYATCGNRRIENTWRHYRPTFADMLTVTNAQDADLSPTMRDHEDLLQLIEARDEDAAVDLLRDHIDGSRGRMLAAYSRFVETPPASS